MSENELHRRGRRVQFRTFLALHRRGPLTARQLAELLQEAVDSVARRLRRYRRRGWIVRRGAIGDAAVYGLAQAGADRARWIAREARTTSEPSPAAPDDREDPT